MIQFTCKKDGLIYYDPILSTWSTVDNNMLFIVGYSRALCDSRPSNRMTIPSFFVRDSIPIHYVEDDVRRKIKEYLSKYYSINHTESGYYIESYGLSNVLDSIGLVHYYKDYKSGDVLYRPHVPLFTKRSCDYNKILTILNDYTYYSELETPYDGINSKYTVVNKNSNRYKYIDLYKSFGSTVFMNHVLYNNDNIIEGADTYSSYFIWNSLAFEQLYHFSIGVLYGLVQLGYGILPFVSKPSTFLPSDLENICLYDEAHFWFQNAVIDNECKNDIFNIDRIYYLYDTFPGSGLRIGVTNSVKSGSLNLFSKYVWGYNLNTTYSNVSDIHFPNKISCSNEGQIQLENICNVEDYDGEEVSGEGLEYIKLIESGILKVELNNNTEGLKFFVSNLPKLNDGKNEGITIFLNKEYEDNDTKISNTSFILSPKECSYSDKIDLPKDLYSLSYTGSIKWNYTHPLFPYLYGKEFSVRYDETSYVTIYKVNENSETIVRHSSVRNLYDFNGSWMNETGLNELGWYSKLIIVYDSENMLSYNAHIDLLNETITYNGITESITDFYNNHHSTLGIVRDNSDIYSVLKESDPDVISDCYHDTYSDLYTVKNYEPAWVSKQQIVSNGWKFIEVK